MNLKELLGDLYTEDIAKKLGEVDIFEKGKAMPMDKYNSKIKEVSEQKNELKVQVDNLNKTLKENNANLEKFKVAATGNEDLQKQLQEYQDKVNNAQKEFDSTLKTKETEWQTKEVNNRKAYAMREKLLMEHADPKYIDMLMNQVDLSKITENEGKFIGVDDIVTGVKTSFDKLFGKTQTVGTTPGTGSNIDPSGITKESLKTMTADQINQNWDAVQKVMKE